jgi:hypothetical protein
MIKYTLESQVTRTTKGAPVVVLNGLPAYKDATMTPKQLKDLAGELLRLADAAERGETGTSEYQFSVCDFYTYLAE